MDMGNRFIWFTQEIKSKSRSSQGCKEVYTGLQSIHRLAVGLRVYKIQPRVNPCTSWTWITQSTLLHACDDFKKNRRYKMLFIALVPELCQSTVHSFSTLFIEMYRILKLNKATVVREMYHCQVNQFLSIRTYA